MAEEDSKLTVSVHLLAISVHASRNSTKALRVLAPVAEATDAPSATFPLRFKVAVWYEVGTFLTIF